MKPRTSYHQRLIAWLFTLTLLVMTLPSHASWQCINGTPCPPKCPMLTAGDTTERTCLPLPQPHCPMCPSETVAKGTSSSATLCPTSQCILKIRTQAEATLSEKFTFHSPLQALLPSRHEMSDVSLVETETLCCPPLLVFYPQRFYRLHPARAPPTLL